MAECINRKAAISLIKQYAHDAIDGGRYNLDTVDDCIELANRIKALPTEDVAPVAHGRWDNVPNTYMSVISKDGAYHGNATTCSVCHEVNPNAYKTNYCPNCGAKMDGGKESG